MAYVSLTPGESVYGYKVIQKIGEGSFGKVYFCEKLIGNKSKKAVIKHLKIDEKDENFTRKLVIQEARMLGSLQHPSIVSLVATLMSEDEGSLYLIMQYCPGGDLHQKLRRLRKRGEHASEVQIMAWTSQIGFALEHIHGRKILHRDVKTQNMFLTKDGSLKLGDFGLARLLEAGTLAQTVAGTPHYLSPELLQGRPYDFKSDIWSLGCCVAEMCTLERAFHGESFDSIKGDVLRSRKPRIPRRYSDRLRLVVHRMLDTNPAKRPDATEILRTTFFQEHMADFCSQLTASSSSTASGDPFATVTRAPTPGDKGWAEDDESEETKSRFIDSLTSSLVISEGGELEDDSDENNTLVGTVKLFSSLSSTVVDKRHTGAGPKQSRSAHGSSELQQTLYDWFEASLGVDRLAQALELLDNPQDNIDKLREVIGKYFEQLKDLMHLHQLLRQAKTRLSS